ncbi:MAG: GTP cyclohydrolase I, partial [Actinomycetota bacterium]
LEAVHLCMRMRGVSQERSKTWTSSWRGNYESEPSLREEFLGVCARRWS